MNRHLAPAPELKGAYTTEISGIVVQSAREIGYSYMFSFTSHTEIVGLRHFSHFIEFDRPTR